MTVRHIEHTPHLAPADAKGASRALMGSALRTVLSVWDAAEDLYAKVQHRRGIRTMLELDDHLLRDMGVTRADVRRAANLPLSESAGDALVRASRRNRGLH